MASSPGFPFLPVRRLDVLFLPPTTARPGLPRIQLALLPVTERKENKLACAPISFLLAEPPFLCSPNTVCTRRRHTTNHEEEDVFGCLVLVSSAHPLRLHCGLAVVKAPREGGEVLSPASRKFLGTDEEAFLFPLLYDCFPCSVSLSLSLTRVRSQAKTEKRRAQVAHRKMGGHARDPLLRPSLGRTSDVSKNRLDVHARRVRVHASGRCELWPSTPGRKKEEAKKCRSIVKANRSILPRINSRCSEIARRNSNSTLSKKDENVFAFTVLRSVVGPAKGAEIVCRFQFQCGECAR